ncbi:MAG: hypothetical protein OD816_000614 [Thermodesulfobacterium sp.]|uniref:Uncharacterized protein n=1 Tax=Candidatus Thermodesulfobacterium syntrophicum TaxID=3060442 RepID=A0AAE3TFR2_9BACT|nr:hypothetical protein [Candidatus Thermodesulfobacterium syntrophicum]
MKVVKYMDENTLIKKSIEVLMEKLGPVETIRFVNLSRKKRMESVRRHREWQKMLNKDKFFNEIFGE